MSVAGEIVDAVAALIGAGIQMDAAGRASAKQEVRDIIKRADGADLRDLLSERADAVTAKHLARVNAMSALIRGGPRGIDDEPAPQGNADLWLARGDVRLAPAAIPTGFGANGPIIADDDEDGS